MAYTGLDGAENLNVIILLIPIHAHGLPPITLAVPLDYMRDLREEFEFVSLRAAEWEEKRLFL